MYEKDQKKKIRTFIVDLESVQDEHKSDNVGLTQLYKEYCKNLRAIQIAQNDENKNT